MINNEFDYLSIIGEDTYYISVIGEKTDDPVVTCDCQSSDYLDVFCDDSTPVHDGIDGLKVIDEETYCHVMDENRDNRDYNQLTNDNEGSTNANKQELSKVIYCTNYYNYT